MYFNLKTHATLPADAFDRVEPIGTRKPDMLGALAGATHKPRLQAKPTPDPTDLLPANHSFRADTRPVEIIDGVADMRNRSADLCFGLNAVIRGPTAYDDSMLTNNSMGHYADSLTREARRLRDYAKYHGEYPGQTFTHSRQRRLTSRS